MKFGDFVFGEMVFGGEKPMNTGVLGKYASPPKVVFGRFLGKIIVFGKFLGNYRLFLGISRCFWEIKLAKEEVRCEEEELQRKM